MSRSIHVLNSGARFHAEPGETILHAALRQGLLLPHDCRCGACGGCKCKVHAGVVDHGSALETTLSQQERDEGYALLCCAHALTDLVIEPGRVETADSYPVKRLRLRVAELRRAAPEVMIVRLEVPPAKRLRFRAGQVIDVFLADGERRSYSIANSPSDGDHLELHVRLYPGGRFSQHVFDGLRRGEFLRIEGPFGGIDWPIGERARLLIAGGTGYAPIQSLLASEGESRGDTDTWIYWGVRGADDLYADAQLRAWAAAAPRRHYVPVLEAAPTDWAGRRGRVVDAVLTDHATFADYDVVACGPPGMVAAAEHELERRGLPPTQFFSDAFYAASEPLAA